MNYPTSFRLPMQKLTRRAGERNSSVRRTGLSCSPFFRGAHLLREHLARSLSVKVDSLPGLARCPMVKGPQGRRHDDDFTFSNYVITVIYKTVQKASCARRDGLERTRQLIQARLESSVCRDAGKVTTCIRVVPLVGQTQTGLVAC